MSQASRYFNGSQISMDLIITTTEQSDGAVNTKVMEKIKENSIGYVKQLEYLSSFDNDSGQKVFLYMKQME